jgi:hypothetical protein
MKHIPWIVPTAMAVALVVASAPAGAGGKKTGSLTDEQFVKYVNAEGKYLQEALAKGKPDKKESRKVLAAALLLQAYALNSSHADKVSVAQNAGALFDAFTAGDLDKTKTLAATFFPKIAKSTEKPGDDKFRGKYGQLMVFFSSKIIGGFGVERELGELEDQKEKFAAEQFARLAEIGQKSSLIASVGKVVPPDAAKGKQDWPGFVGDFDEAAQALTAAATAKNEAATRQALEKLGKTCTKCHDVYRE